MKKTFLFLVILIGAAALTACLPANFAQSRNSERRDAESANTKAENVRENDRGGETALVETVNSATENPNTREPSPTPARRQTKVSPPKVSPPKVDNFVCPEPDLPCHHADKQFDDWELSFRLPKKIVANKNYQSAPFYAVILKKIPDGCGELDVDPFVEKERLKIQSEFSSRKVFAENSCANLSAVNYDFDGKKDADGTRAGYADYIAVYAGATEAEARQILQLARENYPASELKKMTANYELLEM